MSLNRWGFESGSRTLWLLVWSCLTASGLLASGCSLSGGHYACRAPYDDCPSGYTCAASGLCERGGDGDDDDYGDDDDDHHDGRRDAGVDGGDDAACTESGDAASAHLDAGDTDAAPPDAGAADAAIHTADAASPPDASVTAPDACVAPPDASVAGPDAGPPPCNEAHSAQDPLTGHCYILVTREKTWTAAERSSAGGVLKQLASSPVISVS